MSLLDATIVSVFPFNIVEKKPGLVPPEFHLPAAEKGSFEILHVGLCGTFLFIDSDRGSVKTTEFADTVAESVVRDFITAMLGYEGDHCSPGIFWVPGKLTKAEIIKDHQEKLERADKGQYNWFVRIVRIADDAWNKGKSHAQINDMQRYAAKSLDLKRDWLIEYVSI